jgi:hypothetical protein
MGLKIAIFKKGGQTFTDSYAKISGVKYDNDSKIASFGVKIYVSKEDKNLITEIGNQWAKINAGTDMVAQCYAKIDTLIAQQKSKITNLETETALIVGNDNLKLRNEHLLNQLKANELLHLDGSTEW